MASEGRQIPQNPGMLEDDEIVNGETAPPGSRGTTEGGMPVGTPPTAPVSRGLGRPGPEGVDESLARNTHPDGPGVGGD